MQCGMVCSSSYLISHTSDHASARVAAAAAAVAAVHKSKIGEHKLRADITKSKAELQVTHAWAFLTCTGHTDSK